MKTTILSIFLVFLTGLVTAQDSQIEKANEVLRERGEVYFKFSVNDMEIDRLTRTVSLDKITTEFIYAYANKSEFDRFLELGKDFEILTPPSMMFPSILENSKKPRNIGSLNYYPNWDEYNSMMNQFAADYPDLCELVSIGTSNQGKDILCIHINDDLTSDQAEPEFLYTSSIHGDELVGYILTLRLIDTLLSGYGSDPELTYLVNNIDIWINPLANPDGTFAGGNNSVWGATRGNSNNIDLNRNYPDPEDGPNPDGNPWQTETIHWMDFAEDMDFVMSANMHGGAEVVNYPWDTWSRLAADDDWWEYVSREYADLVHEYGWAGYFTDLNNGITNGYAWYSISGGRQDYMNYFEHCREVTLELSEVKTPPESQLEDFWNANYESLLAYMKQVTNGFSGLVTNAVTGEGVPAKVWLDNHELDNSEVYANMPLGNYNRLVKEGNYDVTFSALGFYDEVFNIDIIDDQNYELNVVMMPIGTLISDFSSTATVAGPGSAISFFDHSIGYNIDSWEWTFEGAETSTSTDQNPEDIIFNEIGIYDVTLKITNTDGETDIKVMEDFIEIKEAVIIDNTTVTICDAVFYDSGAENGDYSNDEDYIITFYPEIPGQMVILGFVEFDIENSWNCVNDYFQIFDGTDITAPEIGMWCGPSGPTWQYATNEEGALTVLFHSNETITSSGWKAVISCDSNVGMAQKEEVNVLVYPNPATNKLYIDSDVEISNITLTSLSGINLTNLIQISDPATINLSRLSEGYYILGFLAGDVPVYKKVQVTR